MALQFATAAFCIIEHSKLLLVRSRGKNAFYLPGGKIENGESQKEAVCRELKEELSILIIETSLNKYGTFEAQAYGEPFGVTVVLNCYTGEYIGKPVASSEINEIRYFTLDEYLSMPETAPAVVLLMRKLHADGRIQ
jgi:8-oxo-dGTP pyrophosphatase MutT (NUDIX family)